jgi:hypothetical protein
VELALSLLNALHEGMVGTKNKDRADDSLGS